MSCVALQHHFPQAFSKNDDLPSWGSIAVMIRNHSRSFSGYEEQELLDFADLLDGFAELER